MPKRHRFKRPRVTMHPDGNVTISGLDYQDARSILTAAWLHRHDNKFQPQPLDGFMDEITIRNNASEREWHRLQRWLIDSLSKEMEQRIKDTHPQKPPRPLIERLRERDKDRKAVARILKAIMEEENGKQEGEEGEAQEPA